MDLIVHSINMRSIVPQQDNSTVQVGKPDAGNFVTSFFIENKGRNSLMLIKSNGCTVELRPGDVPLTFGVEWPGVLRCSFDILFETENQQQYPATGARDSVNEAETDITALDAVFHSGLIVETVINQNYICHI